MLGNCFSKNLSRERDKRRMTIKEFSKVLGISASTLFAWENGVTPRDFTQLKLISEKLQLPLYFLIFGSKEPDYLSLH